MSNQLQRADAYASRAMVLVTLVALATGCAGPATSSANPVASVGATQAPSASLSPSPTPSPVATPAPTAAPSALALCATDGTPCALTAGTYSTVPFVHPFLVTIPGGWTNDRAWPHGGELASSSGKAYLQWGSGFKGGAGPSGTFVAFGPTVDDVLLYIQSFKDFAITSPEPITIGGRAGTSVDISTKGNLAKGFLTIPEDGYNLAPGEKVRFMAFDFAGSAVVLMVDIPKEKDFDAELAAMQPVLDSIAWQEQ